MSEPPSPAAPRWFTPITVVAAVSAAMVVTALVVFVVLGDWPPHSSPLWSFAFTAVALLVIAAVVNRVRNAIVVDVKDHVDRRVFEVARRMDARMARITRGMEHAGVQLEDNTGELRRIGGEYEMTGYSRGYADGRAGNRYHPDVPGRIDPDVIDMATRLQQRYEPS